MNGDILAQPELDRVKAIAAREREKPAIVFRRLLRRGLQQETPEPPSGTPPPSTGAAS